MTDNQKTDPIYAAIKRHKAAYFTHAAACSISGDMFHNDPEYEVASAETNRRGNEMNRAATDLVKIVPTTPAGALALLEYVAAFDEGKFEYDETCWSSANLWPDDEDFSETGHKDRPILLPFHARIARNVQVVLRQMLAQG